MQLTVQLFAVLREQAGTSRITVTLNPKTASVRTALEAVMTAHPALAPWSGRVAYAVNREYVPLDTPLREGDELALIPPVSGG